jgi:hypothetical protein
LGPAAPGEKGCAFHGAGVAGYYSSCPSGEPKSIGENPILLMAAHSLRSFDRRRQYPADVAGYHCRCPSGKFKTNGHLGPVRLAEAKQVVVARDHLFFCLKGMQSLPGQVARAKRVCLRLSACVCVSRASKASGRPLNLIK